MSELKPCPFCGGEARLSHAGAKHIIFCPNCVRLPADGGYINQEQAIAAWNNRPDGWISVEDKLPTVNKYGDVYVLVHMDEGFIATTTFVENEGFELWAESGEVTHWQPLPKPPKAKGE